MYISKVFIKIASPHVFCKWATNQNLKPRNLQPPSPIPSMSNHAPPTTQDDSLFANKAKIRKPRNIGSAAPGPGVTRTTKNLSAVASSRKVGAPQLYWNLSVSSMASDRSNASKASSNKLPSSVEDSEYENITIGESKGRKSTTASRSINSNLTSPTANNALVPISGSSKPSVPNDFLQRMGSWLYSTIPKTRSRSKIIYSPDAIWMLGLCYEFTEDGGDVNLPRFYTSGRSKRGSSIFNFNSWGEEQEPDQLPNGDDSNEDAGEQSLSKRRPYSFNVFASTLRPPTAADIRPSISEKTSSSHGRMSPTSPQFTEPGSNMLRRLRAISLTNKGVSDSTPSSFSASFKSKPPSSSITGRALSTSPSQFPPLNNTHLPKVAHPIQAPPKKRGSIDSPGKMIFGRSHSPPKEMTELRRRPSSDRSSKQLSSGGSSVLTTKSKGGFTSQKSKRTEKDTSAGEVSVSARPHSPVRIGKPVSVPSGYEAARPPKLTESESVVLVERPKAPPSIQVSLSNGSEWLDASWVTGNLDGSNAGSPPRDIGSGLTDNEHFKTEHVESTSTPTWEKIANPMDSMLVIENENENIADVSVSNSIASLGTQDPSVKSPSSSWIVGNPTRRKLLQRSDTSINADGGADLDSLLQSGEEIEKERQLLLALPSSTNDTAIPLQPRPRLSTRNSATSIQSLTSVTSSSSTATGGISSTVNVLLQEPSVVSNFTPNQRRLLEFLSDFRSRVAFTYRKDFIRIEPSFYTSDFGWGCMHRCSQSLLCNALLVQALGREWRRDDFPDLSYRETYCKIMTMFLDEPSRRSPFSIHNMASAGAKLGTNIGEWFGPTISAMTIRELVSGCHELDVSVYVSTDGVVYKNDVYRIAHRRNSTRFGHVLVLVATRLGLDSLNPIYHPGRLHLSEDGRIPLCILLVCKVSGRM
ncbi:hypothetical protein BC937DRAFT_87076 [Endogone sp. FLAS-F59071]|nr:hypothetical protein BC937DRAFT_87076 [Endogone sp. FLAS-F59071]|eukprot:RUS19705.1 hypothetical protein BC937DRAFT_87076 [Endogone sp. FLAS-F59071]